jgi:FAD/FMN-containing dehydrogenase
MWNFLALHLNPSHHVISLSVPFLSGGKDPAWDLRAYKAVSDAIAPLYTVYPGSYQSEITSAEGFNRIPDRQRRFWGDNIGKLLAVKRQYDPQGRMVVPYGVGWSGGSR